MPFVIESPAINPLTGQHAGTFRLYVATKERAIAITTGHPDRNWREVALEDMPDHARANMTKEPPHGTH